MFSNSAQYLSWTSDRINPNYNQDSDEILARIFRIFTNGEDYDVRITWSSTHEAYKK